MLGLKAIRHRVIERVLGVPLQRAEYPGFRMGAIKTNLASSVAEHGLVYRPDIDLLGPDPLVRINSACFTGDIFGDMRCDCSDQLRAAFDMIRAQPGLIIYHFHHEGRGVGYTSKLAAYKRMLDDGMDTFEATRDIVNRVDLRSYGAAVAILHDLGLTTVRLLTNNPEKRIVLEANGISVVETVPVRPRRSHELHAYLASKRRAQGHVFGPGYDD